MRNILIVMLGGAIGTFYRYILNNYFANLFAVSIGYGTAIANISGSFFIGLIYGIAENNSFNPSLKLFIIVGLLGGFTTFSSFALETINFIRDGAVKKAILYFIFNNFVGIGMAYLGILTSKLF